MLIKFLRGVRDRQLASRPRICFPHVPKCAGSALTEAIQRLYPLATRALASSVRIDLKGSHRASEATQTPMHCLRENVLAYHLANPHSYLVSGHVACRPSVTAEFAEDWKFITVLRDPIERWISNYVYDRYKSSDWSKIDLDIHDYVETEDARKSGMTYLFYFSSAKTPPPAGEHHPLVEEAVANLRRFTVVGRSDQLDQAAREFKDQLGWSIEVARTNSSPDPKAKAEIKEDAQLLSKIRDLCEPDLQVFERLFPATSPSSHSDSVVV